MSAHIPDDAVVGLAEEDYRFIQAYLRGEVTQAQFDARYRGADGRVAIPVTVVDPGTADE